MMPFVVVGAGIGGLSCALALARRGARVRVLERAAELSPVGAGIQISPNGYRVLSALGLAPEIDAAAIANRAVVLADGLTGREVVRMDVSGAPYRLLHRADLVAILSRAASEAGVRIELDRRVVSVEDGAPARLVMEDGTDIEGTVVGADGLHSVIRPALNGDAPATFTGQVAWRAIVPGSAPPEARIDMVPGGHVVQYPLPGGLVNLVAVEERSDWAPEGWTHPGDPDAFRATFHRVRAARTRLTDVERVHVWGLFLHPVAHSWHGRSVALIGDAAHPTLPFLAQGANLALEDAWTVAEALTKDTLPAWQAARRPRAQRAIRAATGNARSYHLGGLTRRVAHAGLRAVGRTAPGLLPRRFEWLYGHDVTRP